MTHLEAPTGLAAIAAAAGATRGVAPVERWDPAHCGEIDILIRADGIWMHEGSPIGRAEMVRLFSTVLRKDADGYCLVTPVEKLGIRVEDLPFRAVAMEAGGDILRFVTDVGDLVEAGPDHPLVVQTDPATGEPAPRLHVRGDLWARVVRSVFYELVERAAVVDETLTVASGGVMFALGPRGVGLEQDHET
ncbi:MAG: DUF1285 domain-containing protein [Brevundimonas sp.]|nr:MAG: DUF1285 domain-containing protein [Brevundimonas sp.]